MIRMFRLPSCAEFWVVNPQAGTLSDETSNPVQLPTESAAGPLCLHLTMYFYPCFTLFLFLCFDHIDGRAFDAIGVPVRALDSDISRRLLAVRADKDVSFQSNKTVLDTTWVNATLLKQE